MVSYGGKYVDKIKGMGFRGFLSVLHLVLAAWLIITALRVLSKVQILPWYVMDINIISSGILLAVGISDTFYAYLGNTKHHYFFQEAHRGKENRIHHSNATCSHYYARVAWRVLSLLE